MSWFGARPPMGVPMGMPIMQMPMQMGMPMGGPRPGGPASGGGGAPRPNSTPSQPTPPVAPPRKRDIPTGPTVTVFVGNITERAPDAMIRHLLTTCGSVLSWKRVQGATGKLQAFGFCELSNPDAGTRSIRLLNGFNIADKSLVVKVDAKTKKVLDEYITERIKKNGDTVPTEAEKLDEYLDDDMKYEDNLATERINQIIKDHQKEIDSYVPKEGVTNLPLQRDPPPTSQILQKIGTRDEGLDNVEDEKKGIITREIDKFRETMKIREAEREVNEKNREKDREKDREQRDKEREQRRRSPPPTSSSSRRSRDRDRSRDRSRERGGDGDVSPSRGRDSRGRESRSRDTVRSSRRRSPSPRERERPSRDSRSRSRERGSRARDRSSERTKSQKEIQKEREMEQEEKDRRKAEKKATEKEENYQNRLLNWERRESKKAKDYDKDKSKEKKKTEDMEKEGRKLKEFLEDYDDEKDDSKYYKGRELARRMADREREAAKDAEDRKRESDEVDELKEKIFSNPTVKDPSAEFEKRLKERERQYLPKGKNAAAVAAAATTVSSGGRGDELTSTAVPVGFVDMTLGDASRDRSSSPSGQHQHHPHHTNNMSPSPDRGPSPMMDDYSNNSYDNGNASMGEASPSDNGGGGFGEPELSSISAPAAAPTTTINPITLPGGKLDTSSKRRKMQVADIFNQDQDDDDDHKPKKKLKSALPPITTSHAASKENSSGKKSSTSGGGGGDSKSSSVDDKKKNIQSLIEKIPTDKTALFEYNVDWDLVDNQLMEKRIRPWVNKKIAEYIGEPEPTLTDFICSKVLAGSAPKAILDDVQMVLDEEAEVFVVKMWRLLIYEIENKKQKALAAK